MKRPLDEEKTIGLEANLSSLLEREGIRDLFEESHVRERARRAEEALRVAEAERETLLRGNEWLVAKLERPQEPKEIVTEKHVHHPYDEQPFYDRLMAERSRREARHQDELKRARDQPPKIVTVETTRDVIVTKPAALAAELAAERAKVKRLEAQRPGKGLAVAQERIRALESLLQNRVTEEPQLRQERDALKQQLNEWHAHFKGSPTEAYERWRRGDADKAKLQQELDKVKLELASCKTALKRSEEQRQRAEVGEQEARQEPLRRRLALAENNAELHKREADSLRTLIESYEHQDVDGVMPAYLEKIKEALPAVPLPVQKEEEYRVVHLINKPKPQQVQESKLSCRLKERFKEHLTWFREAVYLLTGFKVDMTTTKDGPQIRLRSMFAEASTDALLFQWTDGGVQLLSTPFADGLDERLFANLTLCNSVPAFLANVQIDLFERQTLLR